MQKVIIILTELDIRGNAASSKFAWEGTCRIEDLVTVDIGKGGISSVGEESVGHMPENDGREIENSIQRCDRSVFFFLSNL